MDPQKPAVGHSPGKMACKQRWGVPVMKYVSTTCSHSSLAAWSIHVSVAEDQDSSCDYATCNMGPLHRSNYMSQLALVVLSYEPVLLYGRRGVLQAACANMCMQHVHIPMFTRT